MPIFLIIYQSRRALRTGISSRCSSRQGEELMIGRSLLDHSRNIGIDRRGIGHCDAYLSSEIAFQFSISLLNTYLTRCKLKTGKPQSISKAKTLTCTLHSHRKTESTKRNMYQYNPHVSNMENAYTQIFLSDLK